MGGGDDVRQKWIVALGDDGRAHAVEANAPARLAKLFRTEIHASAVATKLNADIEDAEREARRAGEAA
jgi:hypothetical protein